MTVHICTKDSLRAGIEDNEPFECWVCKQKTVFMDWVGASCDTCHADTAWEDDLAGLVRSIRIKTGLTRKEIAEKSGLKQSTIKNYEWCWPSKKYRDWLCKFIEDYYSDNHKE